MTELADSPRPLAAPGDRLDALSGVLLERGLVDDKTLDRARRVAGETGQRLDAVLTQLGLVSERGLADALAALLGLPLVTADRYPAAPLLIDRLKPRFLRKAHALPIAVEADRLILAMADPLDRFTRTAVAAATGRTVAIEIALPIELDAALNRLYPDAEGAQVRAATNHWRRMPSG